MKIERLPYGALIGLVALTPLVYLGQQFIQTEYLKVFLISLFTIISVAALLLTSFKYRRFNLSRSPLPILILCISISGFVSAIVNGSFRVSFLGNGTEIDTVSFLLLMSCITYVSAYISNLGGQERVKKIISIMLGASSLLALFYTVRFFIGATYVPVFGSWSELAVLGGLILVTTVFSGLFSKSSKLSLSIAIVLFILGAFLVTITYATWMWSIIAIISFCTGVYRVITEKKIPVAILICFVVSIGGMFAGNSIAKFLDQRFSSAPINEVSLQWQSTLSIASGVIQVSPFFGAGPNQFLGQFYKFKPTFINSTPFWSYGFTMGNGYIPSFAVTGGLVAIVLWVLFFYFFIKSGLQEFRQKKPSELFLLALFMWIVCMVSVPSHSLLVVAFILTGLYAGSVTSRSKEEKISHSVSWNEVSGVPLIGIYISYVVVTVSLALWLVFYVRAGVANIFFQKGIALSNTALASTSTSATEKSLDEIESQISSAARWNKIDVYERSLASVYRLQFQNMLNSTKGTALDKKISDAIVERINKSIKASQGAILIDEYNHLNYLNHAKTAEAAAAVNAPGAYEAALEAYNKAIQLNPYDPSIYLSAANIEIITGHATSAQAYISSAIQLKPDYVEAIVTAGSFLFNQKQFVDATNLFRRAAEINPQYPDIQVYIKTAQDAQPQLMVLAPVATTTATSTATSTPKKKK